MHHSQDEAVDDIEEEEEEEEDYKDYYWPSTRAIERFQIAPAISLTWPPKGEVDTLTENFLGDFPEFTTDGKSQIFLPHPHTVSDPHKKTLSDHLTTHPEPLHPTSQRHLRIPTHDWVADGTDHDAHFEGCIFRQRIKGATKCPLRQGEYEHTFVRCPNESKTREESISDGAVTPPLDQRNSLRGESPVEITGRREGEKDRSEQPPLITIFENPHEVKDDWRYSHGWFAEKLISDLWEFHSFIKVYLSFKQSYDLPGGYSVRMMDPYVGRHWTERYFSRITSEGGRLEVHWVDRGNKISKVYFYLRPGAKTIQTVAVQTGDEDWLEQCLCIPKKSRTPDGVKDMILSHLRTLFSSPPPLRLTTQKRGGDLAFFHQFHPHRDPIETFWYRHHQFDNGIPHEGDSGVGLREIPEKHDHNVIMKKNLLQSDLEESRKAMDSMVSRFYAEFSEIIASGGNRPAVPDSWEEDVLPLAEARLVTAVPNQRHNKRWKAKDVPSLVTMCHDVISENMLFYDLFDFRKWVPSHVKPALFRHLVQRGMLSTRHLIRLLEDCHRGIDFSRVGRALSDFHLAAVAAINARSLHTLDLSFCRTITDHGLGLLLKQTHQLQNLHITGCTALTDATVSHISLECPYLVRLSARGIPLIRGFSSVVRRCPDLTYLYAPRCENMLASEILYTMAFGGSNLRYLNLKRSGERAGSATLTDPSLRKIPIKVPPFLEVLKLAYCTGLQRWMLDTLFDCDFPHLRTLDIQGCCTERFPNIQKAPQLRLIRLPRYFPGIPWLGGQQETEQRSEPGSNTAGVVNAKEDSRDVELNYQERRIYVRPVHTSRIPEDHRKNLSMFGRQGMPLFFSLARELANFSQLIVLSLNSPGRPWDSQSLVRVLRCLKRLERLELRHVEHLDSGPLLHEIRYLTCLKTVRLEGMPLPGNAVPDRVSLVHRGLEELTLERIALDDPVMTCYIEGTYPNVTKFTLVNAEREWEHRVQGLPHDLVHVSALALVRTITMMPRLTHLCLKGFPVFAKNYQLQKEIVDALPYLQNASLEE